MARRKDDKRTVLLYAEIEDQLQDFSDEEAGQVFKALLTYANTGVEPDFKDRAVRCLFRNIKSSIDRTDEAYEQRCETNRRIAEERERKRREAREAQNDTNINEREPKRTNVHEEHPSSSPSSSPSPSHLSLSGEKTAPEPGTEGEKEKEGERKVLFSEEEKLDFKAFAENFKLCVERYHSKISPPKHMTDERKEKILALLQHGFTKEDTWKVMNMATASPMLNGRGGKGSFIPDFDWIFEEKNFVRILEGNFNKLK